MFKFCSTLIVTGLCTALALPVSAQDDAGHPVTQVKESFTGSQVNNNWEVLDQACLTAGGRNSGIPRCNPASDADGQGMLRLTPAREQQRGAILSKDTFRTANGLDITFTSYTYGGNRLNDTGADGIAFFLVDGTQDMPKDIGGSGGSLGYSCSHHEGNHVNGLAHAFLGIGIDEFGNFLNPDDNTNTGKSPGPNTIGVRGSGNLTWDWLHSKSPEYYSNGTNTGDLREACKNGEYYSHVYKTTRWGRQEKQKESHSIEYNYNAITSVTLPDDHGIAYSPGNVRASQIKRAANAGPDDDYVVDPISYRISIPKSSADDHAYLSFAYSYNHGLFQPILADLDISDSPDLKPLPKVLRFGFAASTGDGTNVHGLSCFSATPLQSGTSAGTNTQRGRKISDSTQLFLAAYSAHGWWGSVGAYPLEETGTGALFVGDTANWDAKCVLTGGPCHTTDTAVEQAQGPDQRHLFTSTGHGAGQGHRLQQMHATHADRVAWLRGTRSREKTRGGDLRSRAYVLGDIVNASPVFVGSPTPGLYPDRLHDTLFPDAKPQESGYSRHVSDKATRSHVVYVGANDGFVHAFRAGATNRSDQFVSARNDGRELFGYMPRAVYERIVDGGDDQGLTSPKYIHEFYVDATPTAGDLYYGNHWHTWLVGGVGHDGNEIYALDITDPDNFSSGDVIGNWHREELTNLGRTVGSPVIARMHNGQWAILMASGLVPDATDAEPCRDDGSNGSSRGGRGSRWGGDPWGGGSRGGNQGGSNSQHCSDTRPDEEGIYIGLVDNGDGGVSWHFLGTGKTPQGIDGAAGGITDVAAIDLDGDHIVDYLYAGDTRGRVWRFDVTGDKKSAWAASSTPVFKAEHAGRPQPITSAITVLSVLSGSDRRIMLYFGTGQKTPKAIDHDVQYATGRQTFYGVWDPNPAIRDHPAWQAYLTFEHHGPITAGDLMTQTTHSTSTDSGPGLRTLSTRHAVCWAGSSKHDCRASAQFGWALDLPGPAPAYARGRFAGQNEQIIYDPAYENGAIVVNTAIPPDVVTRQCSVTPQEGWTMAFHPLTGGGFTPGFFNSYTDRSTPPDGEAISGIKLGGVGTPTGYVHNGTGYLITQTTSGSAKAIEAGTTPPTSIGVAPERVSWRELVTH